MSELKDKILYKKSVLRLEETVENESSLISKLKSNYTNVDEASGFKYDVDGCGCMSCGCHKSAWSLVLSPAGIAAGMGAYATAAAL